MIVMLQKVSLARLVSLLKTVMRRNGGGNSASNNRGLLTDLYVSPEAMEDIRNWGVDQVDEVTRREIYTAADGSVKQDIFGVNLHDLDELGDVKSISYSMRTLLAHYQQVMLLNCCWA